MKTSTSIETQKCTDTFHLTLLTNGTVHNCTNELRVDPGVLDRQEFEIGGCWTMVRVMLPWRVQAKAPRLGSTENLGCNHPLRQLNKFLGSRRPPLPMSVSSYIFPVGFDDWRWRSQQLLHDRIPIGMREFFSKATHIPYAHANCKDCLGGGRAQ